MGSSAPRTIWLLLLAGVTIAALCVGLLLPDLRVQPEEESTGAVWERVPAGVDEAGPAAVAGSGARLGADGALEAALGVPATVDMVMVIEKGTDLRSSRLGSAASAFFAEADELAQSRAAWSGLASRLGWSESELFDRLLGQRVVLVARSAADGRSMLWCLMCDVTMETDARLKERLESSPRAIEQGRQILTLEKGRYELTSLLKPGSKASRPDPTRAAAPLRDVRVVLAPTGQSELFDEMVASLQPDGGVRTLAQTGLFDGLSGEDSPEMLLVARLRSPALGFSGQGEGGASGAVRQDQGRGPWSGFVMITGSRGKDPAGSELLASVVYRDPQRDRTGLDVPLTTDGVFRSLSATSLLTIVQSASLHAVLGSSTSALDLLRELPRSLPESVRPLLGSRQVLSIRRAEVQASAAGSRSAENGVTSGRVAAALALETSSPDAMAGPMDAVVAAFVHNTLEQGSGLVQPAPYNFNGQLPRIPRVLPIRMGEGSLLRLVTSDRLAVTWSYPKDGARLTTDGPTPGWWVVDLAPMPSGSESLPSEIHREIVRDLLSVESGAEGRWIWLASARPAELESVLPVSLPDAGGLRSAMKRFAHAELRVRITPSGDLRGDMVLRLSD
ncbi:MAG: hypothetical protein ACK4WH_08065 [Phycisphaerales bacterium]